MTLDEAVQILNAHKHNGGWDWQTYQWGTTAAVAAPSLQLGSLFTEFEAVAIAQRYVRDDAEGPVQV